MKAFFTFLISLFIGISLMFSYFFYIQHKHEHDAGLIKPSAQSGTFDLNTAPKAALTGTLISFQNTKWQSRTASISSDLSQTVPILEGEMLETKDSGNAVVSFPSVVQLSLTKNTSVEFIQTLPLNFILKQDSGTVKYVKNGTTPVSVRALNLLVHMNNGTITESISDDQTAITVDVTKGSITAAYNDSSNVSNVVTATEGQTLTFDNDSLTSSVK